VLRLINAGDGGGGSALTSHRAVLSYPTEGQVTYTARFSGWVLQALDLKRFPQVLSKLFSKFLLQESSQESSDSIAIKCMEAGLLPCTH
jgi:hypothetical protein